MSSWIGGSTTWELKPLRALAECRVSNVDKVPSEDEEPVRLCNYTDVYNSEFIHPRMDFMRATATEMEIEGFGLHVGDVVITKDSETWKDIGVPALVTDTADDLVCGYHLALLRPKADVICGRFLFRAIQARQVQVQFEIAAKGMTRYGLPKFEIGKVALPLPPLSTQHAIADFLDEETARLDALVAAKERLLKLLAEKRRAIVTRAVTQGVEPISTACDARATFPMKRLKQAVTLRHRHPAGAMRHGVYVGLKDIEPETGRLVDGTTTGVGIGAYETDDSLSNGFERGDVLFGKLRPYLAKAWVAEFAGRCTTEALVMRPISVDPRFLVSICLSSWFIGAADASTFGSKMPRAEWDSIGNIPVPVPDLQIQRNIVNYLDRATAQIDALMAKVREGVSLVEERRAALIAAAVTGQLQV